MSQVKVTNKQDFLKACVKLVSESDINKEAGSKLIELMMVAFDVGVTTVLEGHCEVTL